MNKRKLSILLIILLTICLITNVFALDGTGAESDPYQITTCLELSDMRNDTLSTTYYQLFNDIDCSDTINWNGGAGFEPIPNYASSLDGNFKKINGLFINRPTTNNIGLFGSFDSATSYIKDLFIEDFDITGKNYVSALVGFGNTNSPDFTNIHARNLSIVGTEHVGGFLGLGKLADFFSVSIIDSSVYGLGFVGGIIGTANGNVNLDNVYSNASITATSYSAGGFTGSVYLSTSITDSYFSGIVDADENKDSPILGECQYTTTISNVYYNNETIGNVPHCGSVVGVDAIRGDCIASCSNYFGMSTLDLKKQATFTGFDFSNIWSIDEDISFPTLQSEIIIPVFTGEGAGSLADPFIITSCLELNETRFNISAHYKLGNDIDCLDTINWDGGAGFQPILGSFRGTLDGNHSTISDLYINRPSESFIGLFYKIDGSNTFVKNLYFDNPYIRGDDYTGVLAGWFKLGDIDNVNTINVDIQAGENVGGVIGRGEDAYLFNVSSSGNIVSSRQAGGIIGGCDNTDVTYAYSRANVSGSSQVGGICGASTNGAMTVTHAYVSGKLVSGTGSDRGSEILGWCSTSDIYVVDSYYANDSGNVNILDCAGMVSGCSHVCNNIQSKTLEDLKKQSTFETWDFDNIWYLVDDEDFPRVQGDLRINYARPIEEVDFANGYEYGFIVQNTNLLAINYKIIDEDSATVNCSLYQSTESNMSNKVLDDYDYFVLNNTESTLYLEPSISDIYEDSEIYYEVECNDGEFFQESGVNQISYIPIIRYSEADISTSIINIIAKGMIVLIIFIPIIILIGILFAIGIGKAIKKN